MKVAIQLLPILSIPSWLWIWAGIIVIIKIVNQKNRTEYYNQISYIPIPNVRPKSLFLHFPPMFPTPCNMDFRPCGESVEDMSA